MVYYKKIFFVLLLIISFLFILNSESFAFSFVDKNGEIRETSSPSFADSPIQIITYYDGFYYFMCPNIPNQSGWYWYVDNNTLKNNWVDDSPLGNYNSMYCTRQEENNYVSWSPISFGEVPESILFSNLVYNSSNIYDNYGSDLIVKPAMNLEELSGLGLTINSLLTNLPMFYFWNYFNISITFFVVIIMFVFGIYIIRRIKIK